MTTHFVIPDTQVRPGVNVRHLRWIGREIAELQPDRVIHLGDHWDMPSLSSYDAPGSKTMESQRYRADVSSGNAAMAILTSEIDLGCDGDTPELHLLRGNHENRIMRAIEATPKLEGVIGFDDLASPGWEVHDFLDVVELDGVRYSHYFYNPMSGRPYGGMIETRLKQIGFSFTMGHQQVKLTGERYVGDQQQRGLVAGACYLHDEDYKGPQGNHHWRGVLFKRDVRDGQYDLIEISLNTLCLKYEGVPLTEWLMENPAELV